MNDKIVWGGTSLPVEAVIRAGQVLRWHVVATDRVQTVADHSFCVAMIAGLMAESMGINPSNAYICGLYHDLAEGFLGDIPSPAKDDNHRAAEHTIQHIIGRNTYSHLTEALVKVADRADGLRFIRNHGIGSIARWAESNLETELFNAMIDLSVLGSVVDAIRIAAEYAYEARIETIQGPVGLHAREMARLAHREREDAHRNL